MRILAVIHRILRALLHGQVEIEFHLGARLTQIKEKTSRINGDIVEQVGQRNGLTRPLGHAHHLATADEPHKLHQDDIQAGGINPDRLQRALHAGDVAMMICPPDIDGLIVAAFHKLIAVIGDVCGKIGRISISAHEHLVLFRTALGRFIPERTVLFIG